MNTIAILCATYLIIVPPATAVIYAIVSKTRRKLLLLAAISLPVAYALSKFADLAYYNPRPFVVQGVEPLIAHAADNGFPSNHMLLAAMMAALVFVYNRPLGLMLGGVAVLVGWGRVMTLVHHPVDIVGSACIVLLVVWGVYVSIRRASWYH